MKMEDNNETDAIKWFLNMNYYDENVKGMVDCILADQRLCDTIQIHPFEQRNQNNDPTDTPSLKCDEEMPTFNDNPSLKEEVTKFYHDLQCTTNSMIKWINDIEETQPDRTNTRDITRKTEYITAKLITLAHKKHNLTAKIQDHRKTYEDRSIHNPLDTAAMYDEIIQKMITTFQLPSNKK